MRLPEEFFGDLIPQRDLPAGRISEFEAKERANAHGEPITTKQFRLYRRFGLVQPGPDGRYEPVSINQLIAIKRTASYARQLARRTVFLRGYYQLFPVSPDKLHQALTELVPLVKQPARKLARVARHGRSLEATRERGRLLPPVKVWDPLFMRAPMEFIPQWAHGWYAMARDGIPAHYYPGPNPLGDIPFEEQVLLLAVLDLDRRSISL
jgi:hypothetical protein